MPTQAQSDAGYSAAWAIAQKDIETVENSLSIFVKPQVVSGVNAHMEQIKATVRAISDAAIDAALELDTHSIPG